MKTLTIKLSKEQHARLLNVSKLLRCTPEELVITETFETLDGWGSWEEFEGGRSLSIIRFAHNKKASRYMPEHWMESGLAV